MVLEPLGLEVRFLGLHDMLREIEHVLGDFLVGNIVEIFRLLAHFVGIAQRHAHHALAARLQRDDVLARGEHHLADRDHALLADGFADHGERLLPDFPVRHDEVGIVEVELVDLLARHELVDIDHPLALDRNRFELLRVELEILALADLVALDDVGGFDLVAAVGIDLAIFDAMAGVLVELVKADLFPFAGRR